MIRHIAKLTLLATLLALVVVLSCHDSVTLPPVKGPPMTIPEQRGPSADELSGRPLEVTHTGPRGQLNEPHAQIAISFSKPMVSLTKVEDRAAKRYLSIKPEVAGKQRWLGSRTLLFEPDGPLPGSTRFSVSVPAGIEALDGTKLEQGKEWTFSTPRLKVSRIFPRPGSRWVTPDTQVSLFFNQPVAAAQVEKHARFLVAGDGGAAAPFSLSARVKRGKNERQMVLRPATAFPKNAKIIVELAPELSGTEGPLTMEQAYSSDFRTYGPLRVVSLSCTGGCDPDYSVNLRFSNPVQIKEANRAIRVNGRRLAAGSSTYHSANVYLGGRFKPRTTYRVTVDAGLKDRFGQPLQPGKPLTFTTGDYEPMVHMPLESTGVLEASAPRKQLPIYFRNATSARLDSKRLSRAEVARLLEDPYIYSPDVWLEKLSGVAKQQLSVKGRPNARVVRRVNLGGMLGKSGRGMLALELRSKVMRRNHGEDERTARALLRVTDLAVTAKYSPHTTLVWTTSLAGGAPVPGVEVAIWQPGGKKPLWTGAADQGGLAVAPGVNELVGGEEERRFIFFVRKGDDESFVLSTTRGGIGPWDFGLEGTWEGKQSSMLGMLFTDRGIYRPGEPLHVKGVFRRSGARGLETPGGMKVKLTVTDSRGEELRKLERTLNEFGSLDFKLDLPPGAPLGSYSVVARPEGGGTAYGSFSVEEYRPAEFKVEVAPERKEYVRGDTLSWTSTGTYLFGAAMRGADVRWYLHQSQASYQPPENEGFVFADEVRWWQDDESSATIPLVARGSGKLNRSGAMAKSVPLKPSRMAGPMAYQVETTVTDVSRQSISSRASVLLHPGEFYVGARPKETFLTAGDKLEAELVAVTPKGKRLAGKKIDGTLFRRTWHSVRKQGMNGAHYFVTLPKDTEVGSCRVVSAARPRPCTIPVAKSGYYFLRLSATDPRANPISASFGLYVAGPDYVPWRRDNDDRVELVTDRKQYKVGQTARILIKSPFSGAHGLFTVERSGILTRRPFRLKGTSTYMQVPITAELQPDAYVSVVLVRGRVQGLRPAKGAEDEDPGKPTFKVGYAKLSISRDDRRLRVTVKPEREEYRPGQQVNLELNTKDSRGKPVKAEVTVMVADEGVLSLIGYRTPSPMSIFYADRGLSVRTADNRLALISPKALGEKGRGPGGGGGGEGEAGPGGVRKSFVSTPFFDPQVHTDGNGRARVTFKLPDNLTTFRIMAVAVSAGAEFGSSQGQVRVKKPLLLLPALPRLARVGDRLEAGVVVHNHSGKDGQVQVRAKVRGVRLDGPGVQTVSVPEGGSAEARFTFQAEHPGEAVLRFDAELGDHHDALELRKPVKLPVVMEAVATHGSTTGATAEGIVPSSAGIRTDVGGLELAMSSSALVGLKGGVEYLLDYPYECVEQTTSRLVPLVMLRDLTAAFGLEGAKPAEINALAAKLVARLETLQRWNGGFAFWPSSHEAYPWASAYATWGLAKAKQNGFKVSQQVLKRAKSYLEQALKREIPKDELEVGWNIRAFLVYTLTELGEKPTAYLNNLYDNRKELAVFGKALLLSAVARLEPRDGEKMIETLVDELGNQIHQTGRLAKVEENLGDGYAPLFHSNVRSTAMVLDALLVARPEHPLVEKLTRYLLEVRKEGRWGNTQESAYSLIALQRYYRVREKQVPDFLAKVVLGQDVVLQKRFKGRSLAVQEHDVPMKKLAGFKGPLGFIKQGDGRLYYTARLRYARKELPTEGWDEGFYVTRTYERVPQDGVSSMASLRGDPNKVAKGVTEVRAGDLVRVTLRIIAPQQMHFVAVEDPLPAGLEAVNFRLVTAAQSLRRGVDMFGYRSRHSHRSYSSAWYTPFYHQEIRDDRVQLFADSVPPGIHTYVYLARATTIGTFVAPPTHVEEMYEPEVFGRTGALDFEVKE